MAKSPQPFTVRNAAGGYVACYRTLTAQQAIDQHIRDQCAYQAQFRRTKVSTASLTASVEPPPPEFVPRCQRVS